LKGARMTTDMGRKHLPPYVSYRTFHNFVDRLQQQGTPQRIDRSYWSEILSGSTGPQLMAAMRFLGLIDANAKPTPRLLALVPADGEKRVQLIRGIASEAFSFVTKSNLDLASATYAQLDECFQNSFSLTDDVKRKCVKFFIAMAGDGGISISPHIIKHTRSARNGAPVKNGARKTVPKSNPGAKVPQPVDIPQPVNIPQGNNIRHVTEELPDHSTELIGKLLDKFPNFDPGWNDELKQRWMVCFDEFFRKLL
jgi:hypothetical protein